MARIQRTPAKTARRIYSFTLEQDNVEKVKKKVDNLSEWVDKQFENEANIMDWTDEQKMVWRRWLAVQPDAVRDIATSFPPTKTYTGTGIPQDRYTIRSYDHNDNGTVTLTLLREDGSGTVHGVNPSQLQQAP
jgi:hypothetical protein